MVVVVEVLRWEVEEEQSLEQSRLEEIVEPPPPPLQPCTAGNIGRMLHSRHRLRTDPGLHHNIGHIGQRSLLH
jgi:hypothetical protein